MGLLGKLERLDGLLRAEDRGRDSRDDAGLAAAAEALLHSPAICQRCPCKWRYGRGLRGLTCSSRVSRLPKEIQDQHTQERRRKKKMWPQKRINWPKFAPVAVRWFPSSLERVDNFTEREQGRVDVLPLTLLNPTEFPPQRSFKNQAKRKQEPGRK